ncbi:MAG: hypothetical protein AAFW00_27320 [Bacteroidota bacterium]
MKTGLFYIMEDAALSDFCTFRYLRRKSRKQETVRYHIYLVIKPQSMEWFYNLDEGATSTNLFKLSLGGILNSQELLTQQLNNIKTTPPYGISPPIISTFSSQYLSKEFHSLDDRYYSTFGHYSNIYIPPSQLDNQIGEIYFSEIFLDFLFDFYHTETFQACPNFVNIHTAIKGNFLFRAIYHKVEYLYQQAEYMEACMFQDPLFLEKDFQKATQAWIDILLDTRMPLTHKASPWFDQEKNLEDEIEMVMLPQSRDDATITTLDKLRSKYLVGVEHIQSIINFQTQRLNLSSAWQLSHMYFKLHSHLLVIGILLLLVPIIFLFSTKLGWLSLLLVGLILSNLFSRREDVERDWKAKEKNDLPFSTKGKTFSPEISLFAFLTPFMPRLFITIFIAWLSLGSVISKAPNLEVSASLGYGFVLTVLIWFYLFQKVQKTAPDLALTQQYSRPFMIILIAYFYSGLIGAIILSIAFRNHLGDIPQTFYYEWGYEIAFNAWLTTTVWAVFFGLFINSLFSGKRFTGF